MRKVIIMGAGGRDFHDFNVVFRNDPDDASGRVHRSADPRDRRPALPARRSPARSTRTASRSAPRRSCRSSSTRTSVDEVVLAYSDLSHEQVMHKASTVLAAGADFRLLGPKTTMLRSRKPVIAVGAVRTGAGKSQTSRRIGQILLDAGLKVAHRAAPDALRRPRGDARTAVRHHRGHRRNPPDDRGARGVRAPRRARDDRLRRRRLRRDPRAGGGGSRRHRLGRWRQRLPVLRARTCSSSSSTPCRPGHELRYHPGETNLRIADVVVVNKVDSATPEQVDSVIDAVRLVNPDARLVTAASPVTLGHGSPLHGKRVLIVEDGPTITHGEMEFGAGKVAAREGGASVIVDPRAYAVGSIAETLQGVPAHRKRPAGDGLQRRAAPRARVDDQRDPVRRRRHGHADRPCAADPVELPGQARDVRAPRGRTSDPGGRPPAGHHDRSVRARHRMRQAMGGAVRRPLPAQRRWSR